MMSFFFSQKKKSSLNTAYSMIHFLVKYLGSPMFPLHECKVHKTHLVQDMHLSSFQLKCKDYFPTHPLSRSHAHPVHTYELRGLFHLHALSRSFLPNNNVLQRLFHNHVLRSIIQAVSGSFFQTNRRGEKRKRRAKEKKESKRENKKTPRGRRARCVRTRRSRRKNLAKPLPYLAPPPGLLANADAVTM